MSCMMGSGGGESDLVFRMGGGRFNEWFGWYG